MRREGDRAGDALGAPVNGWALFELGDRERGLAEIERGVSDQAERHSALLRPYYLLLEVDALRRQRQRRGDDRGRRGRGSLTPCAG